MEISGIRKSARVSVYIPALFRFTEGSPIEYWGRICDLSSTGCQIETRREISNGMKVFVTFSIEPMYEFNDICGTVRWVRFRAGYYTAGIEFDQDVKELMQDAVATIVGIT
ncbi:MAG: PilZ domain-containing protein [bacterium]|nr:PilZ domain-containing protein [bacterium]